MLKLKFDPRPNVPVAFVPWREEAGDVLWVGEIPGPPYRPMSMQSIHKLIAYELVKFLYRDCETLANLRRCEARQAMLEQPFSD